MSRQLVLDKKAVRNSFALAVDSYDGVAALQCQVGDSLYANINQQALRQAKVVDIGCGTGYMTRKLWSESDTLLALDIALPMLCKTRAALIQQANIDYCCADAEALPLLDDCVDTIVSNLSLQWCQNLPRVFTEFHRVLTGKGSLVFSTFGFNTLKELKAAWAEVDDYPHVNQFYTADNIEQALTKVGFNNVQLSTERMVSNYANVQDLMRELKGIGAHNVNRGRFNALMGKNRMYKMLSNYETLRLNGLLPATFEIIYVSAYVGN